MVSQGRDRNFSVTSPPLIIRRRLCACPTAYLLVYSVCLSPAALRASRWFAKPLNLIPPPPRRESRAVAVVTPWRKVAHLNRPPWSKALQRKSEHVNINLQSVAMCRDHEQRQQTATEDGKCKWWRM